MCVGIGKGRDGLSNAMGGGAPGDSGWIPGRNLRRVSVSTGSVLSAEHHLGIPQLGRRGVVKIVGDSVGWG